MASKSDNNLPGLIVLGLIIFAIGRCSAGGPEEIKPNTLLSPVEAAVHQPDAPVEDLAHVDDQPLAQPEPVDLVADAPDEVADIQGDTSNGHGFTCSGKRYCREMNSCEEAQFYLNQCGLGRLDGDGDGVPCESIC